MSTSRLPNVRSFRKQHLYLEFASLKSHCPEGIYLSLTPSDPTLWSGVFFVRGGPYAPALLRFQISFPDTYPDLPPLITFSTDIFHPLLVPLTTYTFSTGSAGANDTVSATAEERLPPGGFSLRDGFPQWFGRARRSERSSREVSGESGSSAPLTEQPIPAQVSPPPPYIRDVSIVKVLAYIKSAFEDEAVLDKLLLEYAGNPGAWHAWRSYRGFPKIISRAVSPAAGEPENAMPVVAQKQPGEWNWEGVWEKRVRSAADTSLSDQVLFGGGRGTSTVLRGEMIRFLNMEDEQLMEIRQQMMRIESLELAS